MYKINWKIWGIYMLLIGIFMLTTGCTKSIYPNIIETFKEEERVETFYGEGVTTIYLNGELLEKQEWKQWKGKGKQYRINADIITKEKYFEDNYTSDMLHHGYVNYSVENILTDQQFILYLPYKDSYFISNRSSGYQMSDEIQLGMEQVLSTGSLQDHVMEIISDYEKDYLLTIEDDVKVNNYLTQHIIAVSKTNGETDKTEFWVNQDNWGIIKSITVQGNTRVECEYTKFEINTKVSDKLFEVDISEDAEIEYINSNLERTNEKVSLEEAVERFGAPVFYLEEEGIEIKEVHYIENVSSEYGYVELTYITEDGNELIVQNSPSSPLYECIEFNYNTVEVRGKKAIYVETETNKIIEFIENGIICDVYIRNSYLTKEALINFTNKLKVKTKERI